MSTNISKVKREELLRQVAEIRNKLMEHQDENTNQLLVYLSNIEKDINGKKYGLVFEEHREAVDELLEKNVPVLIEDESLKIDNGGQQNFLIVYKALFPQPKRILLNLLSRKNAPSSMLLIHIRNASITYMTDIC